MRDAVACTLLALVAWACGHEPAAEVSNAPAGSPSTADPPEAAAAPVERHPPACGPGGAACTPVQRELLERFHDGIQGECNRDDRLLLGEWLDRAIDPRATCRTSVAALTTIVRLDLEAGARGHVEDVVARRPTMEWTDGQLRRQKGECTDDGVPYDSTCHGTEVRVRLHAVPPKAAGERVEVLVEIEYLGSQGGGVLTK